MGFLKGGLTFRRYSVNGEVPSDFRERYQQRLTEHAFAVRPGEGSKLEYVGWTTIHNLLDVDFTNMDRWFIEPHILGMMRLDVKTVPNNLFRAMLERRYQDWCETHSKERCPSRVKSEIKDILKAELIAQSLPRVKTVEWCWDLQLNHVFVHNTSESMNERFRNLFYDTFGLTLSAFSPLSFLDAHQEISARLEHSGLSELQVIWEEV